MRAGKSEGGVRQLALSAQPEQAPPAAAEEVGVVQRRLGLGLSAGAAAAAAGAASARRSGSRRRFCSRSRGRGGSSSSDIASMFSSGAAITASSVPTGDASPSFASRFRITPSPRATELHHRLVGLDFGEHVTGFYLVALVLQPFHEASFLHRRRERLHYDLGRHMGLAEVHDFLDRGDRLGASAFAALSRFFAYGIGVSA